MTNAVVLLLAITVFVVAAMAAPVLLLIALPLIFVVVMTVWAIRRQRQDDLARALEPARRQRQATYEASRHASEWFRHAAYWTGLADSGAGAEFGWPDLARARARAALEAGEAWRRHAGRF